METSVLYIKNMVCDRCRIVVNGILAGLGLCPLSVELGIVKIKGTVPARKCEELRKELERVGFELLDDKRRQTIERIKNAIINFVHNDMRRDEMNISDFLSAEMKSDYSALSKLFSEFTGMTIERYYILHRIERVKELLFYDELSLKQIAYKMNYSSTAYLSSQFKSVTGMTPSEFRRMRSGGLVALDKVSERG